MCICSRGQIPQTIIFLINNKLGGNGKTLTRFNDLTVKYKMLVLFHERTDIRPQL